MAMSCRASAAVGTSGLTTSGGMRVLEKIGGDVVVQVVGHDDDGAAEALER